MMIIAHRGNNKEALENSRDAYQRAVNVGAQRIELDVQLTRDGYAVINHDDHLMHTTGKNLFCSRMTRRELESIQLTNGERIPFLDEVVTEFLPKIELNIEIKGNNPDLAKATAKSLQGSSLRKKVVISCFEPLPLQYLRDHEPDLKRACLVGDGELPWPYFSHIAPINFMQMTAAKIIHPRMDIVTPNFMDQAKARGWKVYTWAPMVGEDRNRENIWITLMTLGVDGHCTNYPTEMLRWQRELEEYQIHVKQLGWK